MTAQSALAIGVWCGARACTAWGKPGKYLQLSPEERSRCRRSHRARACFRSAAQPSSKLIGSTEMSDRNQVSGR